MATPTPSARPRGVAALAITGAPLPLMLALLATVATACGTTPSTLAVASLGHVATTTTTVAAAGNTGVSSASAYTDALAFSRCMRRHREANFPNPTASGGFVMQNGRLNGEANVNPRSPNVERASRACQHLLPNGGQISPAEQQRALTHLLKFVACMRKHGVPDMPDPIMNGHEIGIRLGPGADPNSPRLQTAQKACGSLLPGTP